jgi:hypothetical protein
MMKIGKYLVSRRLFLASSLSVLSVSFFEKIAYGATPVAMNQILGRPTKNSIALSVTSNIDVKAFVEFGYSKTRYTSKTITASLITGTPYVFDLISLKESSKVYYRIRYKVAGNSNFAIGKESHLQLHEKQEVTFLFRCTAIRIQNALEKCLMQICMP